MISQYPFFHWQEVDIEVVDTDFKAGVNDEKLVIDMLTQVHEIGNEIRKTPKYYVKTEFENMFTKNTQLVPSQSS